MNKCPVCKKSAGSGTFVCQACGEWTHPKCGGYKCREVQRSQDELKCNNCKV